MPRSSSLPPRPRAGGGDGRSLWRGGGHARRTVVGPGLPMVSPRQELVRRYFDQQDRGGFLYAYAIPGMLRVVQSAGRVFRTPQDRGIVVLLDDRFRQDGYRQLIPSYWQEEGLFSGN